MVILKRKKNERQRARTTHGWGSMKKRRGAGNRGGRGNAGAGKRGAHNKPSFFKNKKYLGKHGFIRRRTTKKVITLNLCGIQQHIEQWVLKGKATKEGEIYKLNATAIGFTKLLGSGNLDKKVEVTIGHASSKAVERVQEAGGKVVLPAAEEENVVSG